jgi:hypothetical protein
MPYVIRRNEDGWYVSNPSTNGTGASYCKHLENARIFSNAYRALYEKCGNETVFDLDLLLAEQMRKYHE